MVGILLLFSGVLVLLSFQLGSPAGQFLAATFALVSIILAVAVGSDPGADAPSSDPTTGS